MAKKYKHAFVGNEQYAAYADEKDMMKVFIVFIEDYRGRNVAGAFFSEKLARACAGSILTPGSGQTVSMQVVDVLDIHPDL